MSISLYSYEFKTEVNKLYASTNAGKSARRTSVYTDGTPNMLTIKQADSSNKKAIV